MNLKIVLVFISLVIIFLGFKPSEPQNVSEFKEAHLNGVVFRWKIENGDFICEMKAPSPGWIAASFKPTSGVVQSNLIMGSFDSGLSKCEDHTVIDINNHVQVEELGGSNSLIACDVIESDGYTQMFFTLPTTAYDGYHYNFIEGEEMFVTVSYSQNDDFLSHPIKRTQFRVIL